MNQIPTYYERVLPLFGDTYRRMEERILKYRDSGVMEHEKVKKLPRTPAAGFMVLGEMIHEEGVTDPRELTAAVWAANWLVVQDAPNPFSPSKGKDIDILWSGLASMFNVNGNTMMSTHFGVLCDAWHRLEGRKVYAPSEALSRRLVATELRGLRTEDLRLPFRCIYVALPCDLGMRVFSHETGWHPLEGAYLVELEEGENRNWQIFLSGPSVNSDPMDDAHHHLPLRLKPGNALDDVLSSYRAEYSAAKYGGEEGWLPAFRFLMNVVIYATWPDAERDEVMANPEARSLWDRIEKLPKVSAKRDRLKEELKRHDPRKRIVLGRSVPKYESPGTGVGTALVKRVQVQGHWKQQAHGPALSLRKTIWIQPYWKGPEDGVFETPAEHRLV